AATRRRDRRASPRSRSLRPPICAGCRSRARWRRTARSSAWSRSRPPRRRRRSRSRSSPICSRSSRRSPRSASALSSSAAVATRSRRSRSCARRPRSWPSAIFGGSASRPRARPARTRSRSRRRSSAATRPRSTSTSIASRASTASPPPPRPATPRRPPLVRPPAAAGARDPALRRSLLAVDALALVVLLFVGLGGAHRLGGALRKHRRAYLYIAPAIIGTLILVFFPFFYGIALSFTDSNLYNPAQPISEICIGLRHYASVLGDSGLIARTEPRAA